ncbi:hypothetical protein ACHAXR_012224 [Thalassiosira sp. AJA248-18]
MGFSFARLAGATLMVTATTADDAIWLVPYTSPSLPTCTRLIHGALFVFTLEFLVCGCVVVASGLQWAVATNRDGDDMQTSSEDQWMEEIILGSIGAGICWIIALVLYVRKLLKKKRRAVAQAELHRATTTKAGNKYGAIEESEKALESEEDEADTVPSRPSPWTVISLTTLGALDEVSYFPSLLLAKMFTPLDLCLGTFFAACIILVVVTLFLSQCKPLLHWLDRIPLYGIVTAFAVVLTAGVIVDFNQQIVRRKRVDLVEN